MQITWILRRSLRVSLNWRSARRVSGILIGLYGIPMGLCHSYRARPPPSPSCQIPSSTHLPGFASRIFAGFFTPPADVVGASSLDRLEGHGSASFTCGRRRMRSRAWKGRWHSLACACERLYGSLLGLRGAFPVDHEDKVGPHA